MRSWPFQGNAGQGWTHRDGRTATAPAALGYALWLQTLLFYRGRKSGFGARSATKSLEASPLHICTKAPWGAQLRACSQDPRPVDTELELLAFTRDIPELASAQPLAAGPPSPGTDPASWEPRMQGQDL